MKYKELIESIIIGKTKMDDNCAHPDTIVLNGKKYKEYRWKHGGLLTVCGLNVEFSDALPDDYDYFIYHKVPEPLTNGDRLRNMTDEEIASFLSEIQMKVMFTGCWNEAAWAEWLKEGVMR